MTALDDVVVERRRIGEASVPVIIVRSRTAQNTPAVINLHGQGAKASKESDLPAMRAAAARGLTVVGIDARLHGDRRDPAVDTSGAMPVLQWYAMAQGTAGDVVAVAQYLRSRPELCNGRVGVRGFSMGGCVALAAASSNPSLDPVLVVSAPTDFEDDIRRLGPGHEDPEALRAAVTAFDPCRRLAAFAPRHVMLVHGTLDDTLNAGQQRQTFEELGRHYTSYAGRLVMVSYPGGHHPPDEVQDLAWTWLADLLLAGHHVL